jgi:tRNA threonylcarbamoyladenosine biosynthesis protein TsaE
MMETYYSSLVAEDELNEAARQLLDFAGEKQLWAFYGGMGAGKTTFIRHICKRLGVKQNVSSPTFSIVNEYSDNEGKPVYHFDFYRIKNEQEAIDIGCVEYFESGFVCLIEWPEKILNLLPREVIRITMKEEETKRRITFSHE